MSELSIIIKALECVWEWIDNKDREPDKAMIYHNMIKRHIAKLKELETKEAENV